MNRSARSLVRAHDRSQVEGQPSTALSHNDSLSARVERLEFVFKTGQAVRDVPIKLRTVDGTPIHTKGDVYPISADGVRLALIVGWPLGR